MKPFNRLKVPVVDRAQVNSREGKGLNTMVWAMVSMVVKQVNSMMESLLKNVNPDFPLWGRCEEITISSGDLPTDGLDLVIRHSLGVAPTRWIVCDLKQLGAGGGGNAWQLSRSPTTWTKTHVFFRITPLDDIEIKILLLP